jgi:hypothetical protein
MFFFDIMIRTYEETHSSSYMSEESLIKLHHHGECRVFHPSME